MGYVKGGRGGGWGIVCFVLGAERWDNGHYWGEVG